ncbi:hypothetical protein GCM10027049_29290 [Mucilaginibacter puniceus]
MSKNIKRPILYKGEVYSAPVTKKIAVIPTEPPYPFEAAREKIFSDISNLRQKLETINPLKKMPNETIVCFRVRPEFSAKSYYPRELFYPSKTTSELQEIGSRMYKLDGKADDTQPTSGKIFFVRTTPVGLDQFEKRLNSNQLNNQFRWDIQRLASLDLLNDQEQLLGFDEWEEGRLEAVLHPFSIDRSLALTQFKQLIIDAGIKWETVRVKQYESDGLTFLSLPGNKEVLNAISGYNPLRTVHPLSCRSFGISMRSSATVGAPLPPIFTNKTRPVIGVLDGGYISGNPAIDNYVEYVDYVGGSAVPSGPEHGTAVTSAVLYGALNNIKNTDQLLEPTVTVRNFKVLSNATFDPDLYEVIDSIEAIVPTNPDIQIYNLSLGPKGPIFDDSVSRFTYACDTLSKKHNILFCIAVGNDGEKAGYDRIQSPSDMVNGLAMGAYTLSGIKPIRAPYSCIGPGREGNKMKPDLVAFGGCDLVPIHLLSAQMNQRTYTSGTSFSTPLGSSAATRVIAGSNNSLNPLTSRVLLLHAASESQESHCKEMGHGILPIDIEEAMTCQDKSYTLIYEGEVEKSKYRKFDIPWIEGLNTGKVKFHWTSAALASVDSSSPEDYTTASVEVSFCCNKNRFTYSKEIGGKLKTKRVDVVKDADVAANLELSGWKKSANPITEGGPSPFASEADLKKELKWDSVDGRRLNKMAAGINTPSLYVHAIARGHRYENEKIKFAITLTVEASSAPYDIYSKVISEYPALVPIKIKSEAIVSITV